MTTFASLKIDFPQRHEEHEAFFVSLWEKNLFIMFDRLQKKWKVSGVQVLLILCTFAIGGSLTGYMGKRIMNLLNIEQRWLWILIYILLVTILWPMAVLLVSVFFGQFRFFTGYLKKMGRRMGFVGGAKAGGRKSEVKTEKNQNVIASEAKQQNPKSEI